MKIGSLIKRALTWLWDFFINMKTGLWLILGLVLLSLIGTLLTQMPEGVAGDHEAHAAFLDSVRSKYGGWTGILDFLQLFSVFSSLLFKSIILLLGTSILACSMNRAPRLWKQATQPRTRMGEAFFNYAALRGDVTLPTVRDEALSDVRKVFTAAHYRTIVAPADDDAANLYAEQFRWGPFGTVVAHLAFVLILIGAYLSATTGFRNEGFVLPVGSTVAVGHHTGLSVKARSFSSVYYPDGRPKDYSSELVLYKNGKQVKEQAIRVNDPMRYGGVSFYQSFFGVTAAMKVTDASGKVVFDDAVPLQYETRDGKHTGGLMKLPDQKLTVNVVVAASGQPDPLIKPGQVQLEAYHDDSEVPLPIQVVSQGKSTSIAGLNFTFQRIRQYTGLIAARDRGALYVWIGSTFLVLGIIIVFFFPYRRIWVRIEDAPEGSRVRFASASRRDGAFQARFTTLVNDITPGDARHESRRDNE